MDILFYLHASIAVVAMGAAMFTPQAIHALLYTVFSLLNLAIALYILSAPLAAALLAIIYAGAIMILFVFVVMLLKVEPQTEHTAQKISRFCIALLASAIFLIDLVMVLQDRQTISAVVEQPLKDIAAALIGNNGFLLEMASMVLLAGLVAAIFIGQHFINRKKAARS